jgi:hypothetical protein
MIFFEHLFELQSTQQGQVPMRTPGNESDISIPCINAVGCVLRISVHNTTTLQPESIPKLNVKRLPLLM